MELAVYPKYKPSEKDWLCQIPEHWEEKRVKFSLSYIGSGKTPKGGANVYVNEGISLFRSQNVHDSGMRLDDVVRITDKADALQAGTRVKEHDVLLNITGASIGRTSIVPAEALPANVNQHVCILRTEQDKILPSYLHRLLCSKIAKDQILENENGTSREGLNFVQVANLFFPLPDIKEQTQIANFLDYKTAQIDRLIEKKKALIEKLNEQRIAMITQAVTKGLNPDAPMKDSEVDWLGEVPEHWSLRKLKYCVTITGGGTPNTSISEYWNGNIPWVSPKDMKTHSIDATQDYITPLAIEKSAAKLIDEGNVLIVVRSGILQHSIPVAINTVQVSLNQDMKALTVNPDLMVDKYLFYFINGLQRLLLNLWAKPGCTVESIETEYLMNSIIPFPKLNEQREIVESLDQGCMKIEKMILVNNKTVAKLNEYRTSLITAAVTGKIDVREVEIPKQGAA